MITLVQCNTPSLRVSSGRRGEGKSIAVLTASTMLCKITIYMFLLVGLWK
jgi:hypothetical protein